MTKRKDILNIMAKFNLMCLLPIYFFVETEIGNFIWSDPEFGGDNTFRKYEGTLKDYCVENHLYFGRDKGKYLIKDYCGLDITIIE